MIVMKQKVMAGIAALMMTSAMGNLAAFAEDTALTYGPLTYKLYADTIIITDCDHEAVAVEIPAEIDGLPVVSVEREAFVSCWDLVTMTVDPANTYLEAVDDVLYTEDMSVLIWYGCKPTESFTVPSSVQTIEGYAFYDNKTLTTVTLPEGLTTIGRDAFGFCYNLTTLELPSTLKTIDSWAFCYAGLTSLEIPEGVTSIGSGAFQGVKFTEFTIPSSMTYLDGLMFTDCKELTTLYLPNTITKIGFGLCNKSGLTDVYYDGTMAAWQEIEISDSSNEVLLAATIHCTDGDIVPQPAVSGDATGDAEINIADVILINRALLGDATLDDAAREMADVDGNGTLDATDSLYILKYIVELIDTLPVA